MKKLLLTILLLSFAGAAWCQNFITESGTFLLHKFQQQIGKETYYVSKSGGALTYAIDFKFIDRGSPVSLKAALKITSGYEPLGLITKGQTSRMSNINDSISIQGTRAHVRVDDSVFDKNLLPYTFPIAGYSPGTVQQVLLQYWKVHHEPKSINTLPFGSINIKKQGNDILTVNNKQLVLNRFTISGLIWGNELLWTTSDGLLIGLITNDAEGDKLEMMREPYEALLPDLIAKAATYSMRIFAESASLSGIPAKSIAIRGGTVIDVVNKIAIPNSVVLITDGLIKKVGKEGEVDIPVNAQIINAKGQTILPGLWDMHAHFEQAEWGPAYLAAGVTTVRDCGNEFGYINAIQNAIDYGEGIGPKILKAGIIDGKGPYALGIVQADTKDEAIKAVARYKENGFVQIKIYSSVKPAIVKAICGEAHRLGLTVTGHIPNGMTLQQGVDSGMNMVNHAQYVYARMKRNKDRSVDFQDSVSIAAIEFIRQHHVVIDPTLGVYELSFRSVKDNITTMEPGFYTLPLPLQTLYKNTGVEPSQVAAVTPIMESMKQIVKRLHDEGVIIVAGTDMGFPGYSLARELELYVEAGLTPIEAIQTATIVPAGVMGLARSKGSIEVGKQADLIIVEGDPLLNIRDIRKVTAVIKEGRVYDPAKLHQLVGFNK